MKAIIFDLDGTLLDSEIIWFRAHRQMSQEHGKIWTVRHHLSHMSSDPAASYAILERHLGAGWTHAQYTQRLHEIRDEMGCSTPPLRPGARVMLDDLSQHYQLALASAGPIAHVRQHLMRLGLLELFNVVLGGDDVQHGKPAPDIYLNAVARLGCEVRDCIAVEDSPNGIGAALNAGLKTIAVPDAQFMPSREILDRCVMVTTSLFDLTPAALEEIWKSPTAAKETLQAQL